MGDKHKKLLVGVEDFSKVSWQEEIKKLDAESIHECNTAFLNGMQKAIDQKDETAKNVFSLLGGLTSLKLESDSKSDPLVAQEGFTDSWDTFSIENIHEDTFDSLKAILNTIESIELKARVGDILWEFNRDYEAAKTAITAYLDSAKHAYSGGNVIHIRQFLKRAIGIGAQLSRGSKDYNKAVNFIEQRIKQYANKKEYALTSDLQKILLDHNEGDPKNYIKICQSLIRECEDENNWRIARNFWDLKAKWHKKNEDQEGHKEAINALANTFEKEAEQELQKDTTSYLRITHSIERAIQAYRKVEGNKEKVEKLHSKLVDYQKESLSELGEISHEMDLTKLMEKSIKIVEDKSFKEALMSFAYVARPTNFQRFKEHTIENANKYVFHTLFPSLIMNEEGKTVAKQTSSLLDDNEDSNRSIFDRMCQDSKFYYQTKVQGRILPALNKIRLEHRFDLNKVLELLDYSPWVPSDRKYSYAKAFRAGFHNQWEVAANLLIPQIEHSVRYVLIQRGTILPTSIDMSGIQKEYDLNTTLNMEELKEILTEDVVFDLQSILVSPFGSNLRNRQAHGLISDGGFYSLVVVYIWWLNLRLALAARVVHESQKK